MSKVIETGKPRKIRERVVWVVECKNGCLQVIQYGGDLKGTGFPRFSIQDECDPHLHRPELPGRYSEGSAAAETNRSLRYMNAQIKYSDKEKTIVSSRGIEWTHIFGPGSGFTANPVRGCVHDCRWKMPDGKIVECYAQSFRDRIDGKGAFKNITFHPGELDKIRRTKSRCGIFIDSMSDLLGNGVRKEWIEETLHTMRACPQHVFFVLTKNPRRLVDFKWPDNALVGISAPPSFMYGKELTGEQQQTWFGKGLAWLYNTDAKWKWVSLEPLAVDILEELLEYTTILDWAVIGAGSDGRKTYQPDENLFSAAFGALTCPVFFKGNLDRALAERHGGWREEFPKM